MDFRSDNVTGASPSIMKALAAAAEGSASPYGADEVTARLERRFSELFEHEVAVCPVATGTAANALALAVLAPPWGAIYCHTDAHVTVHECGAPEFFSGAKIITIAGAHGKIAPDEIAPMLGGRSVHYTQPAAITIAETTEAGSVYRVDEIAALGAFARKERLALHMDGARFANAVVALGCTPADLTWRAGVDALSFGATKNGAFAAEAVILFDRTKAAELGYRRKRGGHLWSKMRFLSVQLEAYLEDGLWLQNARHANAMAARLAAGLGAIDGARLIHPAEANAVFVELPELVLTALEGEGFKFNRRQGAAARTIRLVTSFATRAEDVDKFLSVCARSSERRNSPFAR